MYGSNAEPCFIICENCDTLNTLLFECIQYCEMKHSKKYFFISTTNFERVYTYSFRSIHRMNLHTKGDRRKLFNMRLHQTSSMSVGARIRENRVKKIIYHTEGSIKISDREAERSDTVEKSFFVSTIYANVGKSSISKPIAHIKRKPFPRKHPGKWMTRSSYIHYFFFVSKLRLVNSKTSSLWIYLIYTYII